MFKLNIKAIPEIREFLNANRLIHLTAFDIDLSWNIFTSHNVSSMLIEQLIDLEKVRTDNLKFRTDLRDQFMDGWSVSQWINVYKGRLLKKSSNRKLKLVLSTLVPTWLSNIEFHLRPICKASKPCWLSNWVSIARLVARFPQVSWLRCAATAADSVTPYVASMCSPVRPDQAVPEPPRAWPLILQSKPSIVFWIAFGSDCQMTGGG